MFTIYTIFVHKTKKDLFVKGIKKSKYIKSTICSVTFVEITRSYFHHIKK